DSSSCAQLWSASLLGAGETFVTAPDDLQGCTDLMPDVGIVGTPVIDAATKTIYAISKSKNISSGTIVQRIHALDLITGLEKFGGPTVVAGGGPTATFDAQKNNQRPGLALAGGQVFAAWASHCDFGPYKGWVFGYSAADLTAAPSIFTPAPHGPTDTESGI